MNRSKMFVLLFSLAIPCIAAVGEPSGIAPQLRPSADEQPAFVLSAQGAQVYACKPRANDPNSFAWSFVAPEAALLESGVNVGRHYGGPTWEMSSDRSSVKGAVRERQDGGTGNIPWLLLAGTPSGSDGKLAGVTSIQRVATKGGVEPGAECNAGRVGREARVKYTAQYYFYKRS